MPRPRQAIQRAHWRPAESHPVPSDVIALVVLWRLRYKLSLRDLAEMFLTREFTFTYEAVREWEAKLTPALAENLRRKRKGQVGRSWYTDERTSECGADGGICIARSIATVPWSTSC
jgi:transposase-like protein